MNKAQSMLTAVINRQIARGEPVIVCQPAAHVLPEAAEYYTSAFHAGMHAHCSVLRCDRNTAQYLCNFGYSQSTWIDAGELSRFTI